MKTITEKINDYLVKERKYAEDCIGNDYPCPFCGKQCGHKTNCPYPDICEILDEQKGDDKTISEFYVVRTSVQTPEHGELVGNWSEPITAEQVEAGRAALKRNWEDLAHLVLPIGNDEIIIPSEVLCRSIVRLDARRSNEEEIE